MSKRKRSFHQLAVDYAWDKVPIAIGDGPNVAVRRSQVRAMMRDAYMAGAMSAVRRKNTKLREIRTAVADYMRSEGCNCCRDDDDHERNTERLAHLLDVPEYNDMSGYNFTQFSSDEGSKR
jgi:hypothetical protein